MTENQWFKLFELLWTSGLVAPLLVYGLTFLKAHTKDKRLQSAERWALQALASAEQASDNTSDVRQEAIQNLISILDKNHYLKKFDDARVAELIDTAIQKVTKDTDK